MKTKKTKMKTFENLQEAVDSAVSAVLDIKDTASELLRNQAREIVQLKTESRKYADADLLKENQQLKEQLELAYDRFSSKKELKAYEAFCKKHENCKNFPYVVAYPCGGIGVGHKVVCPDCGKEKDVTDISVW